MRTIALSFDVKDREFEKFVEVSGQLTAVRVLDSVANSLVPSEYDYIKLLYSGVSVSNLVTVIFKDGGAIGPTISTLTLGYDMNNNLSTVTKT